MTKMIKCLFALLLLLASLCLPVLAQSTTGSISGTVMDEQQAVLPNVTVTARNVGTNESRTATTNTDGRYRFANLPVGLYEITFQANGFAKIVRSGVELLLNQDAVIDTTLKVSNVQEVVTVTENASLLNTSNAEVSTRFDSKRLSELPLAPNRNILNVALSASGVSQLGPGQTGFAQDGNFSVNGMRLRSNNFMIDGQDSNDPSVTGSQQPINNPDVVQEVRLITNQFSAEYGRAAGSVVNILTKSGSNEFHGSAFWFNNNNKFNARSNLDKAAGFTKAPRRNENQFGGTIGGPILRDRTFFFGSYQRWTDRQLGSGTSINGVPTEAGRQILQQQAGTRPQVAALLKFLPAAQTANNTSATFTLNNQTYTIPLGSLTGANSIRFNNHQWNTRVDHRFNENHSLNARYIFNDSVNIGSGQATPRGLATVSPSRNQSTNVGLNSVLSNNLVNELRLAYQRFGSRTTAEDPSSETIPSIEINQLGLIGFNAAGSRTAIGLAVNLPQFRFNNTYQIIDNLAWTKGAHAMKYGIDFRRVQVKSFFFPTIRGRLAYATLDSFVNDTAIASAINKPVPGGQEIQYYNWYDYFFYAQDEWRVTQNFTLNFGLRYETPGNSLASLVDLNQDILARNNNNPAYRFSPVPSRDKNNFQPRFGFNWRPTTSGDGLFGWLTGGDKLVVRGGYSRTNDYGFININLNVASAFPFVFALNPSLTNAYANLLSATPPPASDLPFITRTTVAQDFRAPSADQFSLEISRELTKDVVMRVGYVGTKGNGLFQTVDGNPVVAQRTDRTDANFLYSPTATLRNLPRRVDLTRGVERLRCNCAQSIYHSLQVSLDKRLSRNFSAGVHYTWSSFIDTASEIFNPQPQGEVAVPQDPYNRNADRARSSYDRPHRFTGNVVYEFPFFREQQGGLGRLLGGWQVNTFFSFQSGTPFTVLNGADPAGVLQGIDGLVGNAIRPNQYVAMDASRMKVQELFVRDQGLRNQALQQAQQYLANNPTAPAGPIPVTLPNTIF
ncbi:MAG TPA: carboxypeptidase regulatory-like domain-containing protein, partial [Blastocatellia bacterium]|nr:carboxypeptidase regulatory-like domain-containing protein [Blastocatellia bacterium]